CTRAASSGRTLGPPLTTRETVARLTPATAATCFMVGRRPLAASWPAPPRPAPPPASRPEGSSASEFENVSSELVMSGSPCSSAVGSIHTEVKKTFPLDTDSPHAYSGRVVVNVLSDLGRSGREPRNGERVGKRDDQESGEVLAVAGRRHRAHRA